MRAFAAGEPFFKALDFLEDADRRVLVLRDFLLFRARARPFRRVREEDEREDVLLEPFSTRSVFCTAGVCWFMPC